MVTHLEFSTIFIRKTLLWFSVCFLTSKWGSKQKQEEFATQRINSFFKVDPASKGGKNIFDRLTPLASAFYLLNTLTPGNILFDTVQYSNSIQTVAILIAGISL